MGIWNQIFGDKAPKPTSMKTDQTRTPEVSKTSTAIVEVKVQDSPPHVLLLTKFVTPNTPENVLKDYWASVLGESATLAFNKLKSAGLIAEATLLQKIIGSQSAASMKSLLKELGSSTSGNKETLAERIAVKHSEIAREKFNHLDIWVCTETGTRLAQKYLIDQDAKRQEMHDRCLIALRENNVIEAVKEVKAFEAIQIFSRGIGVDWGTINVNEYAANVSAVMFSRPKIVRSLEEAEFKELAIGAAMIELLGESKASKWVSEPLKEKIIALDSLDVDTRALMMLFQASNDAEMEGLRSAGVKHVKVIGASDSCPTCQKMNGKRFTLAKVPNLPHDDCSHGSGCRCYIDAEDD